MSSASSSASFKSSGLDPKPAQKSDETTPSLLGQTNTTSDSDKSPAVEHIISTDQDITPPRAENLCSSSSGTAQINSLAAPDGDGPPQLPTLPAASSDNQIPAHFPASFSLLMPGMKCYNTESELVSTIHSTLGPFGITRLTLGSGSRKNTRDETKELFPHKRFSWICSSCSVEQRKVDVSVKGCCGFRIRVLLVENNRDPDHEPHLLIREFEMVNLCNDEKSNQAIGTGQTENADDINSSSDSDVILSDLATEGTRKSSRSGVVLSDQAMQGTRKSGRSGVVLSDQAMQGTRKSSRSRQPTPKAAGG